MKIKLCLLLCLCVSTVNVFAQKIICVEKIIKPVYFYHRKTPYSDISVEPSLNMFNKGYSIDIYEAKSISMDSIYLKKKYSQTDTIKYLTYLPSSFAELKKYFYNDTCFNLLTQCINIDSLIKPLHFIKIRNLKKDDRTSKIGLCYIEAEWLHLRMSDDLADDYFNEPPTLVNQLAKRRLIDIYIPLKIYLINNDVKLRRRFISK